jgi:hypothetical protein
LQTREVLAQLSNLYSKAPLVLFVRRNVYDTLGRELIVLALKFLRLTQESFMFLAQVVVHRGLVLL